MVEGQEAKGQASKGPASEELVTDPVVAILGGGQLGRMLGLAAIPLGVRCRFLDPVDGAPASAVGPLIVGGLGEERALADVVAGADVVTYEWEGVPAEPVRMLDAHVPVRPGWRALAVAQDRLVEKQEFRRLGIGVAEFAAVDDRAGLDDALAALGTPAVLKTRAAGATTVERRLDHVMGVRARLHAQVQRQLGGRGHRAEELLGQVGVEVGHPRRRVPALQGGER